MDATVLTIPFDPVRKTFPREELEDFCINKKVHRIEGSFFQHEALPYWTILISYEPLVQPTTRIPALTGVEQEVFERLRIWRKDKSNKAGFPAYLIATDKQMVYMIQKRVKSLAGFDGIKGFGHKRRTKYGKDIIHIISTFFKDEQK